MRRIPPPPPLSQAPRRIKVTFDISVLWDLSMNFYVVCISESSSVFNRKESPFLTQHAHSHPPTRHPLHTAFWPTHLKICSKATSTQLTDAVKHVRAWQCACAVGGLWGFFCLCILLNDGVNQTPVSGFLCQFVQLMLCGSTPNSDSTFHSAAVPQTAISSLCCYSFLTC